MALLQSDQQLEKALHEGDESVFEEAFRQYYKPLCNYVLGFTNDMDEAEEIVQQLFVDIWSKRKSAAFATSFKSYLYRGAHNSALNKIKHEKIRKMHADEQMHTASFTSGADEMISGKELQRQINSAINSLPEQCRMVFKLSRFEELKYSEIAEHLGISVKTVENHMGKALRILREQLKEYLPIISMLIPWLLSN